MCTIPLPKPTTASHAYGARCHLVHNINVFGALGGFRRLRDRLYVCFEGAAHEAAATSDAEDNDGDDERDADAALGAEGGG